MEIFISLVLAWLAAWFGGGEAVVGDPALEPAAAVAAEVVTVVDGDTIKVLIDGVEETVRYIGIDTPEPYRDAQPACYSQEATDRNRALVSGQTVSLLADVEDRDRYDRLLRYVYIDGIHINEVLVLEGYATTLTIEPNTTQANALQQAQDTAQANAAGLWSACQATAQSQSAADLASPAPAPISIDATSLPPGQQRVLETFGLDQATVTISPAVIACAEAAIGADRLAAITAGDTPAIMEGIKLANCYRTQ